MDDGVLLWTCRKDSARPKRARRATVERGNITFAQNDYRFCPESEIGSRPVVGGWEGKGGGRLGHVLSSLRNRSGLP